MPVDSAHCQSQNDWDIDCEDPDFVCDALDDEGIFSNLKILILVQFHQDSLAFALFYCINFSKYQLILYISH